MTARDMRRPIEYKMPEEMAKAYLKMRNMKESKRNAQEYLCKIVNEEFGLMGHCTRVILY